MGTPVIIEGCENQHFEFENNLLHGPRLIVNGSPVQNGQKRGEMILTRDDGERVTATWKPVMFGLDMPQLVINGQAMTIVDLLKWYQWTWAAIPVMLLFIGGFIGGVLGAIAFSLNARVFRSTLPEFPKFMLSGAISSLAFFLWLMISGFVSALMNG